MIKRVGECALGDCLTDREARQLQYWPGGIREIRGARPTLPICRVHWPTVEAKMADPRHWRAVSSVGVLSFRTTGVSAES